MQRAPRGRDKPRRAVAWFKGYFCQELTERFQYCPPRVWTEQVSVAPYAARSLDVNDARKQSFGRLFLPHTAFVRPLSLTAFASIRRLIAADVAVQQSPFQTDLEKSVRFSHATPSIEHTKTHRLPPCPMSGKGIEVMASEAEGERGRETS